MPAARDFQTKNPSRLAGRGLASFSASVSSFMFVLSHCCNSPSVLNVLSVKIRTSVAALSTILK